MPGIFTGEHLLMIEQVDSNRIIFHHSEKFNGVLIPFFNLVPTKTGFEKMNQRLKEISEERIRNDGRMSKEKR